MRLREIDVFRGLSILCMVFFTIVFRMSRTLPDFLKHNMQGSLHIGDFVLPMFLFASGMSIVFFFRKREKEKPAVFAMDVLGRFGKLALIALFLSPFSAGEALGMDEVMLSALLFLPTVFLARFEPKAIAAVAVAVMILYFVVSSAGLLPDSRVHYLGGYAGAVFYLPVMLCGLIAGKMLDRASGLAIGFLAAAVALMFIVPPYKMSLSPSFMMLSAALSMMVFIASSRIDSKRLEFLGRKPIRYWVLMFLLMVIPLSFYSAYAGERLPLDFSAPEAVTITLLLLPSIYLVSLGIELLFNRFPINRLFRVKR